VVRCLLFGSTGFIGAEVRGRLAAAPGVDLMVSARPAIGGAGPRGASAPGGTAVLEDLAVDLARDGVPSVTSLIRRAAPHVVVNCAGVVGGSAADLVAGNVVAVSTLVTAVRDAAPAARLVHLGSAAEYGRVEDGVPVTESTRPDPAGVYGVSKLAGTALVGASGLDAVVLRLFNLVGPGSPPGSLPGRLVSELRRGSGDVQVGSLDAHRDFVDVRDVADAAVAAALAPAPLPPVLNVGSGRATDLRDLVAALRRVAGTDRRVVETAAGSARSADVPWQCADVRQIRAALGWSPRIDLETSLYDQWTAQ
jgi:NDP-hexose 4-ketoreductase